MSLADDHNAWWAQYAYYSTGPVAWRARHHGQPDPDFAHLCTQVEKVGAHVELDVSAQRLGEEPHFFRNVVALHVRHPSLPTPRVTIALGLGETLGGAAARATEALA